MSELTERLKQHSTIRPNTKALIAEVESLEKNFASVIDECRTISAQRDLVHHELQDSHAEVEKLEKRGHIMAEIIVRAPFCSDCRDKISREICYKCEVERLEAKLSALGVDHENLRINYNRELAINERLEAQVTAEAGRNLDNDKRLTGYESEIERLKSRLKDEQEKIDAALTAIDKELGK